MEHWQELMCDQQLEQPFLIITGELEQAQKQWKRNMWQCYWVKSQSFSKKEKKRRVTEYNYRPRNTDKHPCMHSTIRRDACQKTKPSIKIQRNERTYRDIIIIQELHQNSPLEHKNSIIWLLHLDEFFKTIVSDLPPLAFGPESSSTEPEYAPSYKQSSWTYQLNIRSKIK